MAIRRNHSLSGIIGDIGIRKRKDGAEIIVALPKKVHQSKETKKSAGLFGKASRIANKVRTLLNYCYSHYDGGMINRCTVLHRVILEDCFDRETDTFHFGPDSFRRLVGMEFNKESLLVNNLLVQLQVSIEDDQLFVNIPEIHVPTQLKFPAGTRNCMPILGVAMYSPEEGRTWFAINKTREIVSTQKIVPSQEFIFELPKGTLAVVGLGLKYYIINDGFKTNLNTETFAPAGICAALVNPGTFSVAHIKDIHKDWVPDKDLTLKKVLFYEGNIELVKKPKKKVNKEEVEPTEYITVKKRNALAAEEINLEKPRPAIVKTPESSVPNVARNLKAMGLAIDDIVKATGLSAKDIENL